jgi:hypothetical protein
LVVDIVVLLLAATGETTKTDLEESTLGRQESMGIKYGRAARVTDVAGNNEGRIRSIEAPSDHARYANKNPIYAVGWC